MFLSLIYQKQTDMQTLPIDLSIIRPEVLKDHPYGDYNRKYWIERINRYMSQERNGPVLFYQADDKNEFYVEYTCDEKIRLFQSFEFCGRLLGRGFSSIEIMPGELILTYYGPGKDRLIDDTDANRLIMANHSERFGTIFTKEF